MKRGLLFAGLLLAGYCDRFASGQLIAQSSFDTNREGWSTQFGSSVGSAAIWQSSGGNPGGNLVSPDNPGIVGFNFEYYFTANATDAPASPFTGNISAAYGGSLEYDFRIENLSGSIFTESFAEDAEIVLVTSANSGRALYFNSATVPTSSYTHFVIPLSAAAGWRILSGSFPNTVPATEAELLAALADVDELRIRANYTTGTDTAHLDNVALFAAVPEPSTLLVATLGLLGFAFYGWRRKRAV